MQVEFFDIPGPALITPQRIEDSRGYFFESFKADWFRKTIADVDFTQENQSFSRAQNTIRGLHYQTAPFGQGKLLRCLRGAIFDVAVDIRPDSPTFGRWVSATLSAENGLQIWVPEGFAHGFCTLTPDSEVFYKVTRPYSREHDKGIAYDDPEIGVEWPVDPREAITSEKDRMQPPLSSLL